MFGPFLSFLDECCCLQGIGCSLGQGVGRHSLVLKSRCQALEELIVVPGVATLCEAGFTTCQDVFESWIWVEGTGWIFAKPLMEILWRW